MDENDAKSHQSGLGFVVNPFALPYVALEDKTELPDKPGLYFVIDGSKLLYIGMTKTTLNSRWKGHHRYRQIKAMASEPRIAFLDVDDKELVWVERQLIERFKPLLNDTPVDKIPRPVDRSTSQQKQPHVPNWTKQAHTGFCNKQKEQPKPRHSNTIPDWSQVESAFDDAVSKKIAQLKEDAQAVKSIFAQLNHTGIAQFDDAIELCKEADKRIVKLSPRDGEILGNPFGFPVNLQSSFSSWVLDYYRKTYPDG